MIMSESGSIVSPLDVGSLLLLLSTMTCPEVEDVGLAVVAGPFALQSAAFFLTWAMDRPSESVVTFFFALVFFLVQAIVVENES